MSSKKFTGKTFSKRLEEVVLDSGLKQVEFANSLGISPGYLSGLLSKKKKDPSKTLLLLIECKYGFNKAWVEKGIGAPKNDNIFNDIDKQIISSFKGKIEKEPHLIKGMLSSLKLDSLIDRVLNNK